MIEPFQSKLLNLLQKMCCGNVVFILVRRYKYVESICHVRLRGRAAEARAPGGSIGRGSFGKRIEARPNAAQKERQRHSGRRRRRPARDAVRFRKRAYAILD